MILLTLCIIAVTLFLFSLPWWLAILAFIAICFLPKRRRKSKD